MESLKVKRKYNLTSSGRKRLKRSIRRTRPWERSTGPRTREGKLRSAANAIGTYEHIKNRALVTDRDGALLLMAKAIVNYLGAARRGDWRWGLWLLEAGYWAKRLVELGDIDGGIGRSILASVREWCEHVRQVVPDSEAVVADILGNQYYWRPQSAMPT